MRGIFFWKGKDKHKISPLPHRGVIQPLISGEQDPINADDPQSMQKWNNETVELLKENYRLFRWIINLIVHHPQPDDPFHMFDNMTPSAVKLIRDTMSPEEIVQVNEVRKAIIANTRIHIVMAKVESLLLGEITYLDFIVQYQELDVAPYFDNIAPLNKFLTQVINHCLCSPVNQASQLSIANQFIAEHYPLEVERQTLLNDFESLWASRQGMKKHSDPRIQSREDAKTDLLHEVSELLKDVSCNSERDDSRVILALAKWEEKGGAPGKEKKLDALLGRVKPYLKAESALVGKMIDAIESAAATSVPPKLTGI